MGNLSLKEFVDNNTDEQFFNNFVAAVRGGNNSIFHNVVSQAIMLDDSWILTIESALYSIEQIVRNPRKFIIENELIVDVAKAKRTNSKTVRHLSSHSQYIQNIDKNGDVMPKKLLTAELEEDLAIYENRFICALVNRLIIFVEQRHKDLVGKLDVYDQTNVKMQSEFNYGESKFKCEINLSVQEPPEDKTKVARNKDLFERVDVIRRRLRVLQATDFIKSLSAKKPVRPPIQKTNLLNKNVDYNNCYKLWLYISSFTYLGYSIELNDKNLPVDGDYYDDLAIIAGLSAQSLMRDNVLRKDKYAAVEFKTPQEKDFNLITNFTFKPEFDASKAQAGEESINEYYFRRMKDELYKLAGEGEIAIEKNLNVSFSKFFRAVSRINDELYNDLIAQQTSNEQDKTYKTAVQKKQDEIKQQQEIIKRRNLLLKLKWEELERAQRVQERAMAKLEKLNADLAREKQKEKDKKVKKTVLRTKSKTVKIKTDDE
jgi:hypothetical protein